MENFVVSARKYRPDRFDKVVGQQNITNTLKNAIKNDHLAQAFLFSGPRGVGKTTIARLMAKTLNCTNVTSEVEPCNECDSCKAFNASSSFNVHELDAASNNSVEDIRSLVEQVRIPPQAGAYKVYIIDEVHMLSTAAFNAFLKTLEEPPSYAKFILATTEKHKIIPTILSRCQSYDFHRIPVDQIRDHLINVAQAENIDTEVEALQMIAQKADGALRDALSIFDQVVNFASGKVTYQHVIENLNILDYDYYFRLSEHFLSGNIHDSLLLYDEISIKGFAGQQFLSGLGEHLRNMLVCRDEKTVKLLEVGPDIRNNYLAFAKRHSTDMLLKMISIVNKADLAYRSANNKRLQVELALMQLCSVANPQKKTSIIEEEEQAQAIKPANKQSDSSTASESRQPLPKKQEPTTSEKKITEKQPEAGSKPQEQAKPKEEPRTARLNKRTGKLSTISLKDEIKEQEEKEEIDERDITPDGPAIEVKMDELNQALKNYAAEVKEIKPSFVTDVLNSDPKIKDKAVVELKLTNKIFTGADYMLDLQRFLRDHLKNPFVTLEYQLLIEKADNKVFTSKEKYKRMTEINADFDEFRQQLDLDYE